MKQENGFISKCIKAKIIQNRHYLTEISLPFKNYNWEKIKKDNRIHGVIMDS